MAQELFSPKDRAILSLSDADYARFRRLMEEQFGLYFSSRRRTELEMGVRRAFAASTCPDLQSYYEMLTDPVQGVLELERLANNLTVGETYFFRDAGQMDALAKTVLPEIIARRSAVRTLRIWSAGCSSGEEPYSVAMLLTDLIPDLSNWSVTILATDINTQNLNRARQGLYGEWAFREERARQHRARFFRKQGNLYELSPAIRKMVTFTHLNLARDQYPSYETNTMFLDLILCRNVTIYFPEHVTRMVVDRFYDALADGGWLVIGHSEHSLTTYKRFRAHAFPETTLYQRWKGPAESAPPVEPAGVLASTAGNGRAKQIAARRPATPARQIFPLPVRVDPEAGTGDPVEQAKALAAAGKLDQARDLLLARLADDPTHAAGCALLGKVYANLGNWPEAERWCQLALSVDSLNIEAWYTLALVYQHQGQHARAVEMLKKVVYIDHRDILGHFSLGNLLYAAGQVLPAIKSLENARRLLEARPAGDLVPRADDITVGRLSQTVVELMQIWAKEASAALANKTPPRGKGEYNAGQNRRDGAK